MDSSEKSDEKLPRCISIVTTYFKLIGSFSCTQENM